MEYILENGMRLVIRGKRFMVDIAKDTIYVEPMFYQQATGKSIDEMFNDLDKPAISNEPTPVVSYSEIQKKNDLKVTKHTESLSNGYETFKNFIDEWNTNFGIEDAEQPDRAKLVTDTMSYHSKDVLGFIKHSGGLTHSIFVVLPDTDLEDRDDRMYNRLLAENIAQVSSILYPPLAETLEYPFKI
jgi:hypothetical protein